MVLPRTSRVYNLYFSAYTKCVFSRALHNEAAPGLNSLGFFSQLDNKNKVLNAFSPQNSNSNSSFLYDVLSDHVSNGNFTRAIETLDLILVQDNPVIDVASIAQVMSSCLKKYRSKHSIRNVVYIKKEGVEIMEKIFEQITTAQLELNVELLNMLVYGYSMLLEPELNKSLLLLESHKITPNTSTYNNLILGFTRARDMYSARKLYRKMVYIANVPPSVYTYSIMINGYIKQKKLPTAIRYYYEMLERNLTPNSYIFTHLIYANLRIGDVKEALILYNSMLEENITPTLFALETLIKGLCRNSCVDEALNLFKTLPDFKYTPTIMMYTEIIDACFRENRIQDAKYHWALQLTSFEKVSFKLIDRVLQQLLESNELHDIGNALKALAAKFEYRPTPELTELLLEKNILTQENL